MTLPTEIDLLRPRLLDGLTRLGWTGETTAQPEKPADERPSTGQVTLPLGQTTPLRLPPGAAEQLLAYLALLLKWNKAYNLTSVRNPKDMLNLHLLDCLATIPIIEERLGQPPDELIDVGSGGGLPGIVYAIAWPECKLHLVDTVGKKAAFLNQCKLQLKLGNTQAHHQRIELLSVPDNAPPSLARADSTGAHTPCEVKKPRVFTCRAFATLNDFVRQTWHLRQTGSQWFALKGHWPSEEIEDLEQKTTQTLNTSFQIDSLKVHPPGLEETQRHLICIKSTEAV